VTYGSFVRPLVLLVALIVMAMAAGCASSRGGMERPTASRAAGQGDMLTITADNQNFLDADVYALWNGQRDRVGFITGKSSQTFTVDWRAPSVQLEIDLVAGGVMRTDEITVWEGDHLDLVIPPTQN
jgi:hypothetical protein